MGAPECRCDGRGLYRLIPARSAGEMAGSMQVTHGDALGCEVGIILYDHFTSKLREEQGQSGACGQAERAPIATQEWSI